MIHQNINRKCETKFSYAPFPKILLELKKLKDYVLKSRGYEECSSTERLSMAPFAYLNINLICITDRIAY